MLKSLSVSNLAIVERAEVTFGPGLNVITGETGAGKSVLMGALDLVLGGRAEASAVRDGAVEAEVEAVFEVERRGGGGDRGGGEGGGGAGGRCLTVRRTVTREGRSRAWVDDESISIAELREMGHELVDIHGPRANQRLLEENFQRETLDAFGKVDLKPYASAYARYSTLNTQLSTLNSSDIDDLDFLRFQVNELEEAGLSEEDETLAARHAAAAHAEEIVAEANAVTEALGGDRGASDILASLRPKFASIARHLPAAEAWASEAEDLTVRIEELSRTVVDAVSKIDVGEEDLASLDARLTVVNRLKRKYRAEDVARLLAILSEKKAKLEFAENRDEKIAELKKELAAAEAELKSVGGVLTKARQKAGAKLAKAITAELHGLGFLQAKLSVSLEPAEIGPSGLDRVVFLFEPNPGEAARPLAAIASSGEIARVMLALKVVVAGSTLHLHLDSPPTLVFDEIDANIGGEVGKVVGEKMRAVAEGRQVIAITHLPQSAVYGARHLVVSKSVEGGRTRTHVKSVEGAERTAEIARMLGGEKLTSVVKRHAEELLEVSR